MIKSDIYSVQLYNCSDSYCDESFDILFTKKTKDPCQTVGFYSLRNLKGFSDQKIHTLWKARMQVRRWTRPWPQILSLSQPTWSQARTRLCTPKIPGTRKTVPGQLSESKAHTRRDLQHKSRALATERRTLKVPDGYSCRPLNSHRYRDCRNFSCQYAPGPLGRSFRRAFPEGGEQ